MPETPKAVMRRSRTLLALAFWVPALALAALNLVGTLGVFWQLLQMALMATGLIIFWRELQRVKALSPQSDAPREGDEPPTT
jgi:uncharacterized protein (DUF58 family)